MKNTNIILFATIKTKKICMRQSFYEKNRVYLFIFIRENNRKLNFRLLK